MANSDSEDPQSLRMIIKNVHLPTHKVRAPKGPQKIQLLTNKATQEIPQSLRNFL